MKLLDAIATLRSDASGKTRPDDTTTTSSAPSAHPEDRAERRRVTVMFLGLVVSTASLPPGMDPRIREVIGQPEMRPLKGLTDKNKHFLRQFDDVNTLRRLVQLPERVWTEVKRDTNPTYRTLAKAHAALAMAILIYMPIRLQNLLTLEFERHLFIRTGRGGKIHTGIVEWRGQEQHRPSVRDSAADRQDVGRVSRTHRSENHW